MGRISSTSVAGLDLIDNLFFNQILVHCFFTAELSWLVELRNEIESELTHKGLEGLQKQLVKHCVLCLLEVELSESLLLSREAFPDRVPPLPADLPLEKYEAVNEYSRQFFQGIVLAALQKAHECDTDSAMEIMCKLVDKYRKAPATFRYRLVDRMFALEFVAAPIDCFVWLFKMNLLKSTKHHPERLVARYGHEFIQRLALLCEFDMLRGYSRRARNHDFKISVDDVSKLRELPEETLDLLNERFRKDTKVNNTTNLKHSFPIINIDELEKQSSVEQFFVKFNDYSLRVRAYRSKLGGWLGMISAGAVEVLIRLNDEKQTIFSPDFNEGTLTNHIRNTMKSRGFTISERVIYEQHRNFKETIFRHIQLYYQTQLAVNVAIPSDLSDMVYDGISPHFELRQPSPRRASEKL